MLALMHGAPILPSMSTEIVPTQLSDAEYREKASSLLVSVEAAVDSWLQQDLIDIDAVRTGGLLELCFPNGSKIVINTQPPLHEVWMAARNGGYHYKYVEGCWIDREGREFFKSLSACASQQAGLPLQFIAQAL